MATKTDVMKSSLLLPKCERCQGLGEIESLVEEKCHECAGKGFELSLQSYRNIPCYYCEGKGFHLREGKITCPKCYGDGANHEKAMQITPSTLFPINKKIDVPISNTIIKIGNSFDEIEETRKEMDKLKKRYYSLIEKKSNTKSALNILIIDRDINVVENEFKITQAVLFRQKFDRRLQGGKYDDDNKHDYETLGQAVTRLKIENMKGGSGCFLIIATIAFISFLFGFVFWIEWVG